MFLNDIILFLTSTIAICWSIPFIFTNLFGLQFYKLVDQKITKFIRNTRNRASILNNDEPEGWIIGFYFIGYLFISETGYGQVKKELYVLTTKKFYNNQINNSDGEREQVTETDNKITIYERQGNYYNLYYSKRFYNINHMEPKLNQITAINQIYEYYKTNNNVVALLYGEKGMGKSMISLLLAKHITQNKNDVSFCDTFNPTDPGDSFISLYNTISPTQDNPLIVVLEEFDMIISQIHYNKITKHKVIPTDIFDKTTWNQFLDRFDRKYYPNTIIILTSNVNPDIINSMDQSYIRSGRINLIFRIA